MKTNTSMIIFEPRCIHRREFCAQSRRIAPLLQLPLHAGVVVRFIASRRRDRLRGGYDSFHYKT